MRYINLLLTFLFKYQRQRAQATYMPVKSSTIMHDKQRYKIKQYDKRYNDSYTMGTQNYNSTLGVHISNAKSTNI